MKRTLRNQLHSMINNGASLIDTINYLFTCDYNALEVIEMLTGKGFNCKKELLIDTLVVDYGMSRALLERGC